MIQRHEIYTINLYYLYNKLGLTYTIISGCFQNGFVMRFWLFIFMPMFSLWFKHTVCYIPDITTGNVKGLNVFPGNNFCVMMIVTYDRIINSMIRFNSNNLRHVATRIKFPSEIRMVHTVWITIPIDSYCTIRTRSVYN